MVVERHQSLLFNDETSAEHAHRAAESEFTWFLRHQLDWHSLTGRQLGTLLKVFKDHLVRTRCGLFPAEGQPYRPATAHDDRVGRVSAFHQDHRFLVAASRFTGTKAGRALEPEKPDDERDQRETGDGDDPTIRGHEPAFLGWKKRNRFALVTTVTELKAMAAAAMSGDSSSPMKG